jgi:hypothetical protein
LQAVAGSTVTVGPTVAVVGMVMVAIVDTVVRVSTSIGMMFVIVKSSVTVGAASVMEIGELGSVESSLFRDNGDGKEDAYLSRLR